MVAFAFLALLEKEPHKKARETRSTKTPWLVICEDLVVKRDALVAVSALDEVGLTGEQGVPRMVRG